MKTGDQESFAHIIFSCKFIFRKRFEYRFLGGLRHGLNITFSLKLYLCILRKGALNKKKKQPDLELTREF